MNIYSKEGISTLEKLYESLKYYTYMLTKEELLNLKAQIDSELNDRYNNE